MKTRYREKWMIVLLIMFAVFFGACKTKEVPLKNTAKNLPSSFGDSKDSLTSAITNWKGYFVDPNLLELIDTALTSNLDLFIALQKMEAAKAGIGAAKGLLLPNLSAGASAAQRKFGLYTMDGAGNISTYITPGQIVPVHLPDYYFGLQTTWEVDIWGKLRNKKKAALSRYLSTSEGKNLVITNLIAEVATAYYQLLALDNELDIIRETIQLQGDAFELVSIQKEATAANELAVKQLESQVLNSKALEYEILLKINEFENKMNFLLNRYPQTIKRNKSEFTKPLPFKLEVGIPVDLLKNRPDIRRAEYELVATKADLKAARVAFYPTLNIMGGPGFQAFKMAYLFMNPASVAYSVVGTLSAPLINRSSIKAAFKTANANQQEALFNCQKSILHGYIEVYNEIVTIKNLEKIHQLKSNEVAVLSEAIDASAVLFRTGRANYVEVLMTQKGALQSKIELVNIKQRQFNALVNIYKALGGGWR